MDDRVQIVIDGTSLLLPGAGIKTHIYHWVRSLRKAASVDEIAIFPFLPCLPFALDHEKPIVSRWRSQPCLRFVQFSNLGANPVLDFMIKRGVVFHASQHLRNPPWRAARVTASIFDMTCWLMPETHHPSNVIATKIYGDRVLRRAVACIANSESARHDAVEILKLDEDRISVIYPGVSEEYFRITTPDAVAVARRYGLQRPYALFVGMVEPRKNVEGVLAAYARISPAVRSDLDLVIVGPIGWCKDETRLILANPPAGVHYLGYVPESDLPGLTAAASVFVFPSFYEGFGLPVAQALAAGVPVVTSRGSSLEEIAGGASVMIDPREPDEIASAIEQLACSPSRQNELRARGRMRACAFTWDRHARASLDFFHRIVDAD